MIKFLRPITSSSDSNYRTQPDYIK